MKIDRLLYQTRFLQNTLQKRQRQDLERHYYIHNLKKAIKSYQKYKKHDLSCKVPFQTGRLISHHKVFVHTHTLYVINVFKKLNFSFY